MRPFFSLFLCVILVFELSAAEPELERQRSFTAGLFQAGRYFDCISETRRYLYMRGISAQGGFAYFINSCYYLGGQYAAVTSRIKADGLPVNDTASLMMLSSAALNRGSYIEASSYLGDVNMSVIDGSLRYPVFQRRIDSLLAGGFFEQAELEASDYLSGHADEGASELYRDLSSYKELPVYSPVAAAALSSIIPGSGQAYSGRYADALISMAGVVAAAAGGVYFSRKGERGIGITLFVFAGLFHAGNIYGAYNSAFRANSDVRREFCRRIRESHIPPFKPEDYYSKEVQYMLEGRPK